MQDFDFCSPTYFAFGKGQERRAGELCKMYGASCVLIVTGGGKAVSADKLQEVRAAIDAAGIKCCHIGGVRPNPVAELVYEGIELAKAQKVDFILAFGGGSVIDTAKAIAMGACLKGDFWDIFTGKVKLKKALKVGCILTIAAAGSEGSPNTVITNSKDGVKLGYAHQSLRPVFSILNPEFSLSLPPFPTACGAADIFAHAFERYFAGNKGDIATDRLCEAIMMSALEIGAKLTENPSDYTLRANLMWAGVLAHNNVCGVGRIQDWSSHGLSHRLSYIYDTAHGAALSVIMPAWLSYTASADYGRVCAFGENVLKLGRRHESETEYAFRVVNELKASLKRMGLPTTLGEIGAKVEDIPLMVEKINLREDKTIGSFKRLTKEDMKNIYLIAAW